MSYTNISSLYAIDFPLDPDRTIPYEFLTNPVPVENHIWWTNNGSHKNPFRLLLCHAPRFTFALFMLLIKLFKNSGIFSFFSFSFHLIFGIVKFLYIIMPSFGGPIDWFVISSYFSLLDLTALTHLRSDLLSHKYLLHKNLNDVMISLILIFA